MPAAPEFSSLLISRPRSGAPRFSRLGGLALATALHASCFVAFVVAPFLMLEAMNPPRAGIEPSLPPIRVEVGPKAGGNKIQHGVRNGRNRPASATAPRQARTRSVPRPADALRPPPESELPASAAPDDGSDGPDGPPGDPDGDGDSKDGTPDGDCPGCPGIGRGKPDGIMVPFDEWTPGLIAPSLVPGTRALPAYPDLARRAGLQGTVILLVVVEADGSIGSIEVIKSPDQRWGFDLAAIEAVKRWRYRPALMNNSPVAAYIQVMVEFSLAR